jgi:hypothetical protein
MPRGETGESAHFATLHAVELVTNKIILTCTLTQSIRSKVNKRLRDCLAPFLMMRRHALVIPAAETLQVHVT